MSHSLIEVLGWTYFAAATILGVYSLNILIITSLYWVHWLRRRNSRLALAPPLLELEKWPIVTVQLPLYNEQHVVRRLIDAVAALDYPLDCLQIQVLDDSTDITHKFVEDAVAFWGARGRWIECRTRLDRQDYKAGALQAGLQTAKGEFLAIFDADFVPGRDWLKKALLPFYQPGNGNIAAVQTRWEHLNANYSALTRAQSLGLDGHFGIEQYVRASSGLFLGFNGTAGIWRRCAMEDAGGWSGDTLAEDMDLAYRAQLRGWRIHFVTELTAPAEVPTLMVGFKRQQFRWTKGSFQCLHKIGPQVIHSKNNLWRKTQALIHMSGYMAHPLMIFMLLMTLPLSLWGMDMMHRLPLSGLTVFAGVPFFFCLTSQIAVCRRRPLQQFLTRMPFLAVLGVGIAANNSRAFSEALFGRPNVFERTPKTGETQPIKVLARNTTEHFKVDPATWSEVFLSMYALATAVLFVSKSNWVGVFYMTVYTLGFGWVGLASLTEAQASAASRSEQAEQVMGQD